MVSQKYRKGVSSGSPGICCGSDAAWNCNDLAEAIKNIFIQWRDDIKLGGVAHTLQDRTTLQNDFNKFKKWCEINRQFHKDKCKASILTK